MNVLLLCYMAIIIRCSASEDPSNFTQSNSTKLSREDHHGSVLVESSDYYCSCDLRPYLCDINCCCDKLCTDDDRKIFSHCHKSSSRSMDSKYCFTKSFLYTVNAAQESEVSTGSLFCVAWDNVIKVDEYVARKTITTLSELKKVSPAIRSTWFQPAKYSSVSRSHKHQSASSNLKFGHDLRALVEPSESARDVPTFVPWKLPTSMPIENGICNSFKSVTYLKNLESRCVQVINDFRKDCTSNSYLSPRMYHENVVISKNKPADVVFGSLHLTRHYLHEKDNQMMRSLVQDKYSATNVPCLSSECVAVTVNGSYETPQYVYDGQRKIGACFHAVTSVTYDISYDTKTGITEIVVTFGQSPIIQGQRYLQQTFTTNFNQEINSSLSSGHEASVESSGNPGYIVSKPVIGTFLEEEVISSKTLELVNPLQSLSDGSCKLHSTGHEAIGFKVSHKSGCKIQLGNFIDRTGVCSNLQTKIVEMWKINDKISHFAIFGNSNTSLPNHWTPIIIDNSMAQVSHVPVLTLDGNCPSIITSVSYDIYYADIGLKSEPQSMLLSVVKKHSDPIEVKMQLSNGSRINKLGSLLNPWIDVSFSVSFHDLTIPARPSFAPAPTVKLQLPPDFFYPFFVSSHASCPLWTPSWPLFLFTIFWLVKCPEL